MPQSGYMTTTEENAMNTTHPTRDEVLSKIQDAACTADYCHICRRCTDHWGEHSDRQLVQFAMDQRGARFPVYQQTLGASA